MDSRAETATPVRIGVAITCHNRRAMALNCLSALLPQAGPHLALRVVLVDDGSADGTAEAVRRHFPEVTVIEADGGLYWNGGMTLALNRLATETLDFHLWLNEDVSLDPDALARLLATHAESKRDAIIVGVCRDPASGRQTYGGQRRTGWHPFRLHPPPAIGRPEACDSFQGNCVLVPRSAAQALGPIDPAFTGTQNMGDTDYGLRAGRLGIPILQTGHPVATCALNPPPPWQDPSRPFADRLRALTGPKGLQAGRYLLLARRHGGWRWPLLWLMPNLRMLGQLVAASFRRAAPPSPDGRPLRVVLFEGVVPAYRHGYLARLAEHHDLSVTVFHGPALPFGITPPSAEAALPLDSRWQRIIYWPFSGGRTAWITGLCRILRSGTDVVVVWQHVHDLSIWTLWLVRRLFGRPRLVLNGHCRFDIGGGGWIARLRRRLRLLQLSGADAVLPYTREGRDECLDNGFPADGVFVFNNTIDTAQARSAAAAVTTEQVAEARRRLGIAEDEAVFLFLGRPYREKRGELAVAAVDRLRAEGRRCTLLVVGTAPGMDALRDAAGDPASLHLMAAEHDEGKLAALFRMAIAMVMPDALGLACVHAFAHGVPVVTSRAGRRHGPEIAYVEDGRNGLMPADLTVASFAAALARLLDDPALLATLRAGSRATADGLPIEAMAAATAAAVRHAASR